MRRSLFVFVAVLFFTGFAAPTALRSDVTLIQQLFVMKELKPDLKRVGVLWPADKALQEGLMSEISRAGAGAGVQVFTAEVSQLKDVAARFRDLTRANGIQVLWVVTEDGVMGDETSRKFLIKSALESKVSLLAPTKAWVDEGAPLALANDGSGIQLLINKGAADALALTIPAKYQDRTQFLAMN